MSNIPIYPKITHTLEVDEDMQIKTYFFKTLLPKDAPDDLQVARVRVPLFIEESFKEAEKEAIEGFEDIKYGSKRRKIMNRTDKEKVQEWVSNLNKRIDDAIKGNIKLGKQYTVLDCVKDREYSYMFNYWSSEGCLNGKEHTKRKQNDWKNRREIILKLEDQEWYDKLNKEECPTDKQVIENINNISLNSQP